MAAATRPGTYSVMQTYVGCIGTEQTPRPPRENCSTPTLRETPVPAQHRQQAHFFVIAAPAHPRREMLLDAVHGPRWQQTFSDLRNAGLQPSVVGTESFAPTLSYAGHYSRRQDGAAVTYALTDDRSLERLANDSPRYSEDAFELEITEDGALHLMTTRFSDDPGDGNGQLIFAVMAPVLTRQAIAIAQAISDRTGYLGPWMLGCAATGIAGLAAHTPSLRTSAAPYPREYSTYRATTTASPAEMSHMPGALTSRLVGRLLRTLDQVDTFQDYLTDQRPTK